MNGMVTVCKDCGSTDSFPTTSGSGSKTMQMTPNAWHSTMVKGKGK